jgi:hypothetical protein
LQDSLLPITDWLAGMTHWKDIQCVIEVTHKRTFKNKGKEQIEQEVSYFITSHHITSLLFSSLLWEMLSKNLNLRGADLY